MLTLLLACSPDPVTEVPTTPAPSTVPSTPTGPGFVLSEQIDTDALVGHLEELEAIADANLGHREALSVGYLDSIDYVESSLIAAGLEPVRDPFTVDSWEVLEASLSDESGDIGDWAVLGYSASGTATGIPVAVDLVLPPGPENTSTSGCEASDFDGFPAGSIALIQRGTCPFVDKVANAEAAGATAVLVFNEGQPGRTDVIEGNLGPQSAASIPAVGLSFAAGEALAGATSPVSLVVETERLQVDDLNLLVTLPGSDPLAGTVLVGAHLDSVIAGPGINDNGSGSAFVLELALQAAEANWRPTHPVTFVWWGAEEQGLVGSRNWVYDSTSGAPRDDRLDALAAYLNFDMMASPEGERFIYDGDGSDIDDGGASQANGRIEQLLLGFFDDEDLSTRPESIVAPTDIYWFIAEGVPAGGVFSGAGDPYDVCYHQACDRVDGLDLELYGELARGSAHTLQALAEAPGDTDRSVRRPLGADRIPSGCQGSWHWER